MEALRLMNRAPALSFMFEAMRRSRPGPHALVVHPFVVSLLRHALDEDPDLTPVVVVHQRQGLVILDDRSVRLSHRGVGHHVIEADQGGVGHAPFPNPAEARRSRGRHTVGGCKLQRLLHKLVELCSRERVKDIHVPHATRREWRCASHRKDPMSCQIERLDLEVG